MFDKAMLLFGIIRELGCIADFLDKGYILYGTSIPILQRLNFLIGEKIYYEFESYLENINNSSV